MSKAKFGEAVRRVEDRRFLVGSACYVDDISLPGLAHGAIVYSNRAHARIKSIDKTRALRAPGVLGVLTGEDVALQGLGGLPPLFMPEDTGGPKGYRTVRPLLTEQVVRHVGDRVAVCVAESKSQAQDAAELIEIEYQDLPSVTGLAEATTAGAPQVWQAAPENVCFTLRMGHATRTDMAFAKAAHRVQVRLSNNRVTASPMEPRGAIGAYDPANERFTLYSSTQNPHRTRETLARWVLGIPESKLRVVGPDVGGGFGMKGDTYPEEGIVLAAARAVGRAVKWIATRSDAFVLDNAGRDQLIDAEMALDENGRILAVRANAMHNLGAYIVGAAIVPLVYSLKLIPNVYDIPVVDLTTRGIFTHTAPTNPYRGAGRPEAIYATERLLDLAAEALQLDRVEIRKQNFVQKAALPYRSATGLVYDSGDFCAAADACLSLADWDGFEKRKQKSRAAGKLRGRAVACYIEDTGVFNDRMELRFDPSGALTIVAGTFSHGQSHATTYSQCVSGWLGIPMEQIRFIQGDTEQVAFGRGTYASGSAVIGGSALKLAAEAIVEKAKTVAGFLLEANTDDLEFGDGRLRVSGTDRTVSLQEVAKWTYHPARLPKEMRVGLEASAYFAAEPPAFPNGAHVCELEVDPETGEVLVERYTAVDDFGRIINPLIVSGQVHGALAQGIGQALGESMIHDSSGQLVTASFMDYAMPRAQHLPAFTLDFREEPCTTNPLGVKGAGEGGCVAAPPAVMNAILDALRPLGIRHLDMPATPERIWRALNLPGRR
jgi:aerobic carbon-monoxide dehydrogenase large subunit